MKSTNVNGRNLTEHVFSGFFWLITGSGVQLFLKIAVLFVLARLLKPGEFGMMGVALMVVEFSKMFTHMGVGPAIVQRREIDPIHISTGFFMSILMGLCFMGLLIVSAPLISLFFRMPDLTKILRVVSIVFLFDSFALIPQALMARKMKFKKAAIIEVASYAIGYGAAGILLAYNGWGVWALVGATLSQSLLSTILYAIAEPVPARLRIWLRVLSSLRLAPGYRWEYSQARKIILLPG